jgi:hypothetical protein
VDIGYFEESLVMLDLPVAVLRFCLFPLCRFASSSHSNGLLQVYFRRAGVCKNIVFSK